MKRFITIIVIGLIQFIPIASMCNPPCTATILTPSQEICDDIFPLAASEPFPNEVGLWTSPNPVTFTNPNLSSTVVTSLVPGANMIIWTIFDISGGVCDADTITLTNNEVTTTPVILTQNSQEVCDENNFPLQANPILLSGEQGVWSSVSGLITFAPNANSQTATANNLQPGNNVILWTINKGNCTSPPASITVLNNEVNTNPEIEPFSTFESCVNNGFTGIFANITNSLLPGETGTWTSTPPGVLFTPVNSESPVISNLQPGANLLTWTISRGNCPSKSTSVTLTNNAVQTQANITNTNEEICDENNYQLQGNTPVVPEVGSWSSNPPGAVFVPNANTPSVIVNNLAPGTNTIYWTISRGNCPVTIDSVTLTNNEVLTIATIASADSLEVCSATGYTLNGSTPLPAETGTWTGPPGVSFMPNANSPTVSVPSLLPGLNSFCWIISRGTCPADTACIDVFNNGVTTTAVVSTADSTEVCDEDGFSISASPPAIGETGTWTGPGGVTYNPNANDPNVIVDDLQPGLNTFCWTISRGTCPESQDCLDVFNNEVTTTAVVATPDSTQVCDSIGFTLTANPTVAGETGTWSGPIGVIYSPNANSPTTTADNLPLGTNIFCWTITRGGCPSSQDCIQVTNNEVTTDAVIATADGQQVCDENGFIVVGNAVNPGETGTWTGPTGVSFLPTSNSPSSTVNNLPLGASELCWTISRGTCPSDSSCVTVINNEVITNAVIATADSLEVCDQDNFLINATPVISGETGTWTGPTGVIFVPNSNSPSAEVDNLPPGPSTLCWNVSRGTCPGDSACIVVINNEVLTDAVVVTANNQIVCSPFAFIVVANPVLQDETGTWTGTGGISFFPTANSPSAVIDSLPPGRTTLCWTVSRGGCPSDSACIDVINDRVITKAQITSVDSMEVCSATNFSASAVPVLPDETGTWTGPIGVTFLPNVNDPNVTINNLLPGANTICWTVSRGTCPSDQECITVINNEVTSSPIIATADSTEVCSSSGVTLTANPVATGEMGTWSGPTGVSFLPNSNNPTVSANNLPLGLSTFCWTISRGNCPQDSACVNIINNGVASAPIISVDSTTTCSANGFIATADTLLADETGTWSGPAGVSFDPNIFNPVVTINNLPLGQSEICWSISRGGCPTDSTCVTITNNEVTTNPVIVTVDNQEICGPNGFQVEADPVLPGETGTWTGPTGVIFTPSPNSPTATADNLLLGTSSLCWTVSRGNCPASQACIDVTNNEVTTPSVILTATGQSLCTGNGFMVEADTVLTGETGTWTGPTGVTFLPNANDPSVIVNGLPLGTSSLCWIVSRGTCPADTACIDVINNEVNTPPVIVTADGQEVCTADRFVIVANPVLADETGTWSGPTGVIFLPSDTSTTATANNLPLGTSQLCWTITRDSCPASVICIDVTNNEVTTDAVVITADSTEICSPNGLPISATPVLPDETGTWSGPTGVTFLPTDTSAIATANNLPPGISRLCWTVTRGACPSDSDCIDVINNEVLTNAVITTIDSTEVCGVNGFSISAIPVLTDETGTWTGPTGISFIPNANDPNVTVNNLPTGQSTLCWIVSRGGCPADTACIDVFNNEVISNPVIVTADSTEVCDSLGITLTATPASQSEIGTWTGPTGVTFLPSANNPVVTANNLLLGVNTFCWTLTRGGCPSKSSCIDVYNNQVTTAPVIVTADNTEICGNATFTLEASPVLVDETGTWTGPTGVTFLPNANTPIVTPQSLPLGSSTVCWTVTRGGCPSVQECITLVNNEVAAPVIVTANNQEVCDQNGFIAIATPILPGETGTWTGPGGVIFSPSINSDSVTIDNLPAGTSTLCWTVTRGGCPSKQACLDVTNNEVTTQPIIVAPNGTEVCDSLGLTLNATPPLQSGEIGTWTGSFPTILFSPSPNDPNVIVTGLPLGTSTLCWTVARGGCPSKDTCINVMFNQVNTPSVILTASQEICTDSVLVQANPVATGEIGTWTTNPSGVTYLPNANSPTVTVIGLAPGATVLCWEVSSGNCPTNSDCITITNNEVLSQAIVTTTPNQEVCDSSGFIISGNPPLTGEIGTWTGPTGTVFLPNANDPNPTANNLPPGLNQLCWTISRGGCPTDSACVNVINNEPSTPQIATASGQVICDIETITLIGNAPVLPGETGTWTGPAGVIYNPGPTSPTVDVTNLPSGTNIFVWTLIVGNCSTSDSITVIANETPVGTATPTDVTVVGGSDGIIDICVSGGTMPYTVSYIPNTGTITPISPPATGCDASYQITGLMADTFDIFIEDANGCRDTIPDVLINDPDCTNFGIGVVTSTDETCSDALDGTITIEVLNPQGNITYDIGFGTPIITTTNPYTFTNLPDGSYNITVTDERLCVAIYTNNPATITDPDTLTVQLDSVNVTSVGGNDGSIDVCINGGTSPYLVTYTPIIGTIDSIPLGPCNMNYLIDSLTAGIYCVIVTDANGCSVTQKTTINDPDCMSFSIATTAPTNNSCNGSSDGEISITVLNGVPPYDYSIDGGGTWITSNQNPYTFNNLPPGTYDIVVSDAIGCTQTFGTQVVIAEPSILSGTPVFVPPTTIGGSDGEICLTPSGGTAPYTITASCGTVLQGPGQQCGGTYHISGLSSGICEVIVMDFNGCETRDTLDLNEPDCSSLSIVTVSTTDIACNGASSGTITIRITGASPYMYSIDGGTTWVTDSDSTYTFINLAAGSYDVVVKDALNCIQPYNTQVMIDQVPALDIEFGTNITCLIDNNGSANVTVFGGTAPFTYIWSNGETTDQIDSIFAGQYTVTVLDANGCSAVEDSIIVSSYPVSNINAGVDISIEEGVTTVLVATSDIPGTYSWSPANQVADPNNSTTEAFPVETTVFVVEFTSLDGCITRDSVIIDVQPESVIVMPGGFTPGINGPVENNTFYPVVQGNVDILSFTIWNRWGERVYDDTNPPGWDGTYKGKDQPMSSFVYIIEYKIRNGDTKILKGDFVLIR